MQLTTFSDYCMRTLIYLGLKNNEMTTISSIASAYAISENHLMKIVHFLGQRGYIETTRGKGGGIRLARAANTINIGELLLATEGDAGLLECVNGQSSCCIQSACKLTDILREAQTALYGVLSQYTLADLLRQEAPLTKILFYPNVVKI
ncbi:MAG: Rrf2 family transcriptional regulator [Methylotenera sp.]|nr:Rrf2 family transcriptional regulator [Methylotenera sp.]